MKDLKDPSFSNWLSHRAGGGVRVFFFWGGPHLMILMVEIGGNPCWKRTVGFIHLVDEW